MLGLVLYADVRPPTVLRLEEHSPLLGAPLLDAAAAAAPPPPPPPAEDAGQPESKGGDDDAAEAPVPAPRAATEAPVPAPPAPSAPLVSPGDAIAKITTGGGMLIDVAMMTGAEATRMLASSASSSSRALHVRVTAADAAAAAAAPPPAAPAGAATAEGMFEAPAPEPSSLVAELKDLQAMKDAGALSDDEYAAAKVRAVFFFFFSCLLALG